MTVRYTVETVGIDEQIDRLIAYNQNAERLARDTLGEAGRRVKLAWKEIAPIDTGLYRFSINSNVQRLVGGTVVAIIGTPATDHGFPYPAQLEEVAGYHYRTTKYRGLELKGRVFNMFEKQRNKLNAMFQKMIDRLLRML